MGFTKYKVTLRSFMSNTEYTDTGCLIYTGSNTADYRGYCRISYRGKKNQAHRLMYTWVVGDIPKDKIVMHTCDNRACVNPYHLKLGTNKDNSEDMVSKNRQYRPIGIANTQAKLTEKDALRILWNLDGEDAEYWAKVYSVTKITIQRIWNRKTWKHL